MKVKGRKKSTTVGENNIKTEELGEGFLNYRKGYGKASIKIHKAVAFDITKAVFSISPKVADFYHMGGGSHPGKTFRFNTNFENVYKCLDFKSNSRQVPRTMDEKMNNFSFINKNILWSFLYYL